MHPGKLVVPLAVAIGMTTAAPAMAQHTGSTGAGLVAHVAGGSVAAPTYPGLVNSRLVRTQRVLDRAIVHADDDEPDKALKALYKVRLQLRLAWKAAKYVVDHAPPPAPPGDGALRLSGRRMMGAGAGGGIADAYTTAGAVLALQHTVAQAAIGIIDTSHGTLRDSLSRTIFTALDQRDAAIAYIHSIDIPPPPPAAAARLNGVRHLSGAPVGGTWSSVMPPIGLQVQDEIDQIDGTLGLSTTLGTGIKRVLKDAEFQALLTQRAINEFWPPVVGD